jgi:hypothetical protein
VFDAVSSLSDHVLGVWGLTVGILSIILTILGFGITIVQTIRIQSAANAARIAANNARRRMASVDVLSTYDRLYSALADLVVLHHSAAAVPRSILLHYYAAIQDLVATLRSALELPDNSTHVVAELQKSLVNMAKNLERQPDRQVLDLTKSNLTLHNLIDALRDARESWRKQVSIDG